MVTGTGLCPASVATDPAHGGRWTSLRLAGREWLWHRADPARDAVQPGDPFVDVGGLEECIPTVRGNPDHGAAWSRPWHALTDEDAVVDCGDFELRRRLRAVGYAVVADYRLTAEPGFRFVWAAHALLELSIGAHVSLPAGLSVRLYPEAAGVLGEWPVGVPFVEGWSPRPLGLSLTELGPNDGTAVGASVLDADAVTVVDGSHRLRMELRADLELPRSIALWRNLGGFPAPAPYRSIGVEPMLGRLFDLADAGAADAVIVAASGVVRWQLRLTGEAA
jgi:hypothetical protein